MLFESSFAVLYVRNFQNKATTLFHDNHGLLLQQKHLNFSFQEEGNNMRMEQLHNWYASLNIVRAIKSRRIRQEVLVSFMGEM
jgi:hypothetical protein